MNTRSSNISSNINSQVQINSSSSSSSSSSNTLPSSGFSSSSFDKKIPSPFQSNSMDSKKIRDVYQDLKEMQKDVLRNKMKVADISAMERSLKDRLMAAMIDMNRRYVQTPDGTYYVICKKYDQFKMDENFLFDFVSFFVKGCEQKNGGKVPNISNAMNLAEKFIQEQRSTIDTRPPREIYLEKREWVHPNHVLTLDDPRDNIKGLCERYKVTKKSIPF